MKKMQLYDTRMASAQSGSQLYLEYLLLSEDAPDGTTRFGICIRCTGTDTVYEQRVPDVTSSRVRVEALLRMLADGKVTPVSLREILEDVL